MVTVHTNFHAKSRGCSSKNSRVIAVGMKEDTILYIKGRCQKHPEGGGCAKFGGKTFLGGVNQLGKFFGGGWRWITQKMGGGR